MISGCMNVQTSADLPPGWEANIKESVGALTNGILNNIEKGYSWQTFVTEVRRALAQSKLTQIPQFEVGRLEDHRQPAFARLLPNGVQPVSCSAQADRRSTLPCSFSYNRLICCNHTHTHTL